MPEAVRARVLLGVKALKLLRPGPDDRDCLVPWLCSKSVLQQCEASCVQRCARELRRLSACNRRDCFEP